MFACAALLGATAAAAAPGWRIQPRVRVSASVVRLGDLLAAGASAPAGVRRLVLSAAPQPGMPLRWSAAQLASRLRSAGLLPGEFQIPARIEIERQAQPIPTAAVLQALTVYLRRPVLGSEVAFTPPLTTAADPQVQVLRAVPDRVHGRLEVYCRATKDLRLLPFAVSVRLSPAEQALQARQASAVWRPHPEVAPKPVLVRPGRTAQLVIEQPGFALTTLVQPLQEGRQGDRIRVRSLATKAILQVVVTGRDQVGSLEDNHGGR